ncbi:ankyrin, partial [Microstroma glucosiphilum]
TALHEAASRGFYDLCLLLLSYGAQIDPLDMQGNSPLHHASANGHHACVHLLIEKGANFG